MLSRLIQLYDRGNNEVVNDVLDLFLEKYHNFSRIIHKYSS